MEKRQFYIQEAVSRFFGSKNFTEIDGPSGMNNTTRRVRVGEELYIARIYETHRDMEKVLFEHAVLRALSDRPMSFRVPEPVASLDGETVIRVGEDGKLAAMFRYIDGHMPDFRNGRAAEAFGEAAGELLQALAAAGGELLRTWKPVYPPYYELGSSHPQCSLSDVARFCGSPPGEFARDGENLRLLFEEISRIHGELESIKRLPHQLIHGDLNASNALAGPGGTIAALLDFEFCTLDVRAMDPAVCLWGLIAPMEAGGRGGWEPIEAFWSGFGCRVKLSPEEALAIPALMQLRSLDVFIHFLGRYWDGVDGAGVLAGQIPDTSARMRWVAANRDRLLEILQS